MIAPLNVPIGQRPAFQEIVKLTDDAYAAVRQCFTEGTVYLETDAWLEETSKAVEPHTRLGGQILGAVVGLRSLADSSNMSLREVAEAVALDAESKGYIPTEAAELLKSRLTELLGSRPVARSAKAYSLAVSDAAPFNDVRIVTDVRPIFAGKEGSLDFDGSLIVHHLHIEVGGEGKDQHSALTTTDLLKLRRTVERALEKDKKLREILRAGSLSPLESATATDKEI